MTRKKLTHKVRGKPSEDRERKIRKKYNEVQVTQPYSPLNLESSRAFCLEKSIAQFNTTD